MKFELLNPLRWRKSFLLLILAAFVVVWFTFIDTYSLYTRYKLSQRKAELKTKIESLHLQTAELEERISDIRTNPELLEKIAREEYGMRKPDETVYKIKKK